VGKFTGPDARRCLTPDEMRGKGLRQNDEGQWHEPLSKNPLWADQPEESE
jgi:hypothetical protein